MKQLIIVLFSVCLMIGGLTLQIEIGGLNMTDWNFTGANIMRGIVPYFGGFTMLTGVGALVLMVLEEKRN